jgi:hypothetical protein
MPQDVKADAANASTGEAASLQGLVATREDERALIEALEAAFDYRGDVTITKTDGSSVTGYVFDRRTGDALADSKLRMMAPGSDAYIHIGYDEIDRLEFTGKDTAHGKTFERWIERFVEKKLAGQQASIENEPLD